MRTPISIFLLGALLVGILTPTSVCAFMCRRYRAEDHHHCVQAPGAMPGMAHNHSAMHHHAVSGVTTVVEAPSCRTECYKSEQIILARKVVLAVTVVPTRALALDATPNLLLPHLVAAWTLDSGPPSPFSAHTTSYSILRI